MQRDNVSSDLNGSVETERGRFIVIEGLDGAGTTTQSSLLADWLRSMGRRVHETAEPSDGPIGRLSRQVLRGEARGADGDVMRPRTIAGLFVADRADHLACEIEPALSQGTDVISDRYVHSSLAYQGVECDIEWVAAINGTMRIPDLTIFVEVPAALAAERRSQRRGDPELYEVTAFQEKVADGYRQAMTLRPQDRVELVDGAGDVETVHRAICAVIEARLPSMVNKEMTDV